MSPLSTGSPQSNIEYWFNLPALISEHARFNDSTLQENKQGKKKKRVLFISRKHCEFCSLEKGNIDFCKTVPSTHIPPFQHHQEHLPACTSGLNVLKHTSATQMHAWSRNLNVSFSNWTSALSLPAAGRAAHTHAVHSQAPQTKQQLRTEVRASAPMCLLQGCSHCCVLVASPSQTSSAHRTSKGASATHHEGFSWYSQFHYSHFNPLFHTKFFLLPPQSLFSH